MNPSCHVLSCQCYVSIFGRIEKMSSLVLVRKEKSELVQTGSDATVSSPVVHHHTDTVPHVGIMCSGRSHLTFIRITSTSGGGVMTWRWISEPIKDHLHICEVCEGRLRAEKCCFQGLLFSGDIRAISMETNQLASSHHKAMTAPGLAWPVPDKNLWIILKGSVAYVSEC